MAKEKTRRLAVLTGGSDAPGMNAALRAVVRAGLSQGFGVYAIREGYQGLVAGDEFFINMDWDSVGGILQRGGTIIGSAQSPEFRSRDGRRQAAKNLVMQGIDHLVVIGGDGSLIGAALFQREGGP